MNIILILKTIFYIGYVVCVVVTVNRIKDLKTFLRLMGTLVFMALYCVIYRKYEIEFGTICLDFIN